MPYGRGETISSPYSLPTQFMDLILFSHHQPVRSEANIIQSLVALTQHSFHLYKPTASKQDIASILNQLDEDTLKFVVLHHHQDLANDYPVKGTHRQRHEVTYKRAISCTLHEVTADTSMLHVDYAFFSPVFPSISKVNHKPRQDVSCINAFAKENTLPLIALGGLTPNNISLLEGFSGVALKGAVWQSNLPEQVVKDTLSRIG